MMGVVCLMVLCLISIPNILAISNNNGSAKIEEPPVFPSASNNSESDAAIAAPAAKSAKIAAIIDVSNAAQLTTTTTVSPLQLPPSTSSLAVAAASLPSQSQPSSSPRRLTAVDRDNKLMSVLAARRQVFSSQLNTNNNNNNNIRGRPHHHHRYSDAGSAEYQATPGQRLRSECAHNCTNNFTTRGSAVCMNKCVNSYKVDLSNSNNSSHNNDPISTRLKYSDKHANTILVDELLDTEESQSTGSFIVHSRDRYASGAMSVASQTKDQNSTNIFNKINLKNNIIENEVRQTSTEKVYSKFMASRFPTSTSIIDSRHKRVDPAKLRQRISSSSSSLASDRSVEDSDLSPYPFFGQKITVNSPSRSNESRNQIVARRTPISAMSFPTKVPPSKLDAEEIMELSVSKQPPSHVDRNKIRRLYPQNRNIVTLNRKYGGAISRAEFEALTSLATNAAAVESAETLSRNDGGVVPVKDTEIKVKLDEPVMQSSKESVVNMSALSRDLTKGSEEIGSELEHPTLLIHVPDPEPAAVTDFPVSLIPSTTTTAIRSTIASTTTTPTTATSTISTTTPSTSTTTHRSTRSTTTGAPFTEAPAFNPPTHRINYQPFEDTPNLIEFLPPNTTTSPPKGFEKPSTATPRTEVAPTQTISSSTPQTFTRTTVSSSVRSTINPVKENVTPKQTPPTTPVTNLIPEETTPSIEYNLSSIFPQLSGGVSSKLPVMPELIGMFPNANSTKKIIPEDIVLRNDSSDVTIEMHRMNMATYVLAGLGMFPVVMILLYLAKTVLFRKGPKTDEDLERYISEEHKKISPVVKLEHSSSGNPNHHQPQSIYSDESIMTEESFNRNLLKFKSLLGEGNFGQVWKAEADDLAGHMGTTRIVAVKTERVGVVNGGLRSEAAIMKRLGSHMNVVTLLGACTAKEPHLLIMEFAMRGRLLSLLRAARNASSNGGLLNSADTLNLAPLSPRRLAGFGHDIARGMEYISERKIVHRDLAARNVLLDHNGVCKICDFGMSIDLEKSHHLQTQTRRADILRQQSSPEPSRFKFDFQRRSLNEKKTENCKRPALPIRWMAPEALQYHIFSPETDVWAFGIVLWEISTLGCTPYPTLSGREVVRNVPNGTRPDIPIDCRPELYELMTRTWRKDPRQRPTFTDARIELSRSLCQWEVDDNTSDYLDISGFSEDLEHGMVYFNRRIPEFECEI